MGPGIPCTEGEHGGAGRSVRVWCRVWGFGFGQSQDALQDRQARRIQGPWSGQGAGCTTLRSDGPRYELQGARSHARTSWRRCVACPGVRARTPCPPQVLRWPPHDAAVPLNPGRLHRPWALPFNPRRWFPILMDGAPLGVHGRQNPNSLGKSVECRDMGSASCSSSCRALASPHWWWWSRSTTSNLPGTAGTAAAISIQGFKAEDKFRR